VKPFCEDLVRNNELKNGNMRRLIRPSAIPPTLVEIAQGGEEWKEGIGRAPADGKWNRVDVRGVLYAMHGRACAYCQKDLLSSRGDVDHFRPQALYPWLKYEFNNFLLSCHTCNRIYKNDRFPLAAGAKPVSYSLSASLADEPRLLLDPAHDDVEKWLSFNVRDPFCPAVPAEVQSKAIAAQVDETILFFQLNLDPRLVRERNETLGLALDRIEEVQNARREEKEVAETIIAVLRRSASRFRPHGIVVRVALGEFLTDLLPTPVEEVLWLIEDLAEYLSEIDQIKANNPGVDGKWLDREAEESCFALASIALASSMDHQEVGKQVSTLGLEARIKPYIAKLRPQPITQADR
jgi:uncharacterized protein (TIGR02646 family)